MENNRLQNLLAAFESQKDDPFVRYAIAIEFKEAGELQRSKEFFDDLYKLFPDYVPQYYHYGKLLEDLDELETAKAFYTEGIQKARAQQDSHAASELQGALTLLEAQLF